uniref:probable serine/threonine protein kinase IREH1 n=1 Tax=Erigeron canadensis TaxID=72917 RepID=UPI001CB8D7B2|nr:probable serine/threonine protein kinase IREH1 [Erigeron canadensis]
MVFKGRFFSSKKSSSSGTSSPEGSNSPTSNSNSPIRSDHHHFRKKQQQPPKSSTSTPSSKTQIKKDVTTTTQVPITSKPPGSTTRKPEVVAVSPILASSLGLNRIKTRSGPLPQESFLGFNKDSNGKGGSSSIGASNLSKSKNSDGVGIKKMGLVGDKKKIESLSDKAASSWADNVGTSTSGSSSSASSDFANKGLPLGRSPLRNGESSSEAGRLKSRGYSGNLRSSDICTPETKTSYDCENPKESESPRFQAILRVTSAPRKRYPTDIKSFSHELNSKGVRPYPLWKPRGLNNVEEVLSMIRGKFDKAKEEVDADLHIFAGDLLGILEKNAESQPQWQENLEDLLVLAQRCAMTSPGEFWLQCEGIVQELDDKRQELPMGILKQLHTRMLFILTRCTRLLQFHKESGLAEDELVLQLRQSLHSADKHIPGASKGSKVTSTRKFFSEEQHGIPPVDLKIEKALKPENLLTPPPLETIKNSVSPSGRDRMASWKPFPSPGGKSPKEEVMVKQSSVNLQTVAHEVDLTTMKPPEPVKDPLAQSSTPIRHQHRVSWGWGDQPNITDESSIICRICEEEVPTLHVEDHSRVCAIADRCDQTGLRVDERLVRVAETLEKLMESISQKDYQHVARSPDGAKVSNSSVTEEGDPMSPKLSDLSRRGSEDMLDCVPESDNSVSMEDLKGLTSMSCRTRFGPKSDQGMTTSSAGSMTPRSPLMTPRTSQIDLLLAGKGAYSEHDDLPQMNELADIARCAGNTPLDDDRSLAYLLTCLDDLRVVIDRRKFDALTVQTFGDRIEKLIREKYLQLCEMVDDEKVDISSTVIDEDAPLEDDVVRSLRTSPIHSGKDRTSIDDFEIIKPISRGAFGRVFLAKKRTTGDLFAIKVLKKADMIRKNAVESILAERDILISVRNPFVVRFFYSFTCRENLYLVMEYLNGGDLYSLLRNLGCLDEDVARIYIAEVVLALEYLHSLRVVHRDLKPDNLLIAHDGHIKLTDFGLSKVGLINSTDPLSGPAVSGTALLGENESQSLSESQQERRKNRSAVGTPDYLAPEILLGTGHGTSADWWSVGVILFELIVGIPPFNAEHPQMIFDNILNRNIPWPAVPEEMSPEAQDLIDQFLTEDPNQRLGARGATEVKQHPYFRDINWDTLARQKAAFIPSSESALDTSYFTSRYTWSNSEQVYAASETENSSDDGSMSGSSSCVSHHNDEGADEFEGLTELDSGYAVNYSFSNFSFKNLSQLASINYDLLTKGLKEDPPTNPTA